jgi:hypothetical protein
MVKLFGTSLGRMPTRTSSEVPTYFFFLSTDKMETKSRTPDVFLEIPF